MPTTLSSKGHIVLPPEIRARLGLPDGAVIDCQLEGERIVLTPMPRSAAARVVSTQGYPALEAPEGAPEMTPERVREILSQA